MRSRVSLLAAVVFSSLLFGCGSGREDSATDAERLDPDNCPASTVRVVSKMDHYDPYCGQPCTSTSDCPSGMACVVDMFGIPDPAVPVCVSDSVPPPGAPWTIHVDMADSTCVDSMTLGKLYVNEKTGIAGYEHIACPQGCEATGAGWQATARCL
jgi:hypothetical protein